jgi:hypothetical protein
MRSRTIRWGLLVLFGSFFLPGTAAAQHPVLGAPYWEHPLPLMWGERNQGFYFATEALAWRVNSVLQGQVLAQRGFYDLDGSLRGTGPFVRVSGTDGVNTNTSLLRLNRGTPGQFIGSGEIALTADDAGESNYRPGIRLSGGYRLANGIAVEFSYWALANARNVASAGVTPPLMRGIGSDAASSFLTVPFFNFSPFFVGPARDVISGVMPEGLPPVITDPLPINNPADSLDVFLFGGPIRQAIGIGNAAEIVTISLKQKFHNGELNFRAPIFQGEDVRTYTKVGFRYMSMYERFKMRVVDQSFDGNIEPSDVLLYSTKQRNRFWGAQGGFGSEVYLMNGFSLSGELLAGVAGQTSKNTTTLDREDFAVGFERNDSRINITPFFNGGLHLWWYPIEGVQLRVGYEYLGVIGARRTTQPVDFNLGRLEPNAKNTYLSFDGFTIGFGLIF